MSIKERASALSLALSFALLLAPNAEAGPDLVTLPGHVPAVVAGLNSTGRLPATNHLTLAIGLPLRNQAALEELLQQLYDPQSTNYHKFLTSPEFTARFGPTEQDYQAVGRFAETHGLSVVGTHSNRVVLDVSGSVSNIEQAFNTTLRIYPHPKEARDFFAPDVEPSVPTNLPVADMWGLSDYSLPRPLSRKLALPGVTALNYNGSGMGGAYLGNDFRNAYVPQSTLNGAGQIAAVVEFDGYYVNDIATYEAQSGYSNVPLQNVLVNGVSGNPGYSGQANAVAEVSLDIELLIAMAPGLTKLMVYEGSSPYDVFNKIATDNTARQISCSWAWNAGPTHNWGHPGTKTLDSQLQQMAAQGQSFFQASGDSDAYTGSQALSSSTGPIPVDSIYVTSVGGTTLTMNGAGASWVSETVWNWGNNTGSGGGISPNYGIPSWQMNVSMAANSGSAVNRNVPDVALTADAIHVVYNNGTSNIFGGTSCAAPLWAGFCALVNQQAVAIGGATNVVGFLNPALYAIAASSNYTACFHDITTGNNIGTNTPGLFNAVAGYDLATGLGTPNGTNLINALAPARSPYFVTQPSSQTVTNGTSLTFNVAVGGQPPISYKWLFNGTNLPAGGNISGTASNILSITSVGANNAGNYNLVASNNYGSATSSVAVLTVGFPPAFSTQPTNVTVLSGGNTVLGATVSGSAQLVYQWRQNGTNLVNGTGISGATSNILTLTTVTTNRGGNYSLAVTNGFGVATSSVAVLTVVLPPTITSSSLTNRTVECSSNNVTFSITALGTPPIAYQWSLDGLPVSGATQASFSLTNVPLPNHTIGVTVTNLYGSVSSNALLTVRDTIAPVIILNGSNPLFIELSSTFTDPGATATDMCAGTVAVAMASGTVNTSAIGTNTLIYTANDGNGNTNSTSRSIIVRDTTPPTIVWNFTNLVLAADTNCSAPMPDLTGTNFIRANDASGLLTISQIPTNNALLQMGTNLVIIIVRDASSNSAYSTNFVVVSDQTPPVILGQPQSQTNIIGTIVNFSAGATACTPLAYQWFFNDAILNDQTNNTLTITNVSPTNVGSYYVVANSSGGSSTSVVATLTVNLIPTSLALNSSINPSGYKDDLIFAADIAPSGASGTVQFLTNGVAFDTATLTSGRAVSTNTASLPRGTNLITAIYSGDASHLPATGSLEQIITNHPPTAATAFYTRTADAALNITVADLTTNWTDIDGDLISLADVAVSTNGVTVTNNNGTLVYFNSNNVADQFVCTIIDGWGGTNIQTVNISITPTVDSTPTITGLISKPDGTFDLTFAGAPSLNYILESTTNLISPITWLPVVTNSSGTNGQWLFNDSQVTSFQQRFYRLKLAQ
jgi:Pro-kumamolisin, activation domain/Domain of unknown function (DUF5011)/Immunoglobulin I-set domain/Bacterial Ig-like domain (group 3)